MTPAADGRAEVDLSNNRYINDENLHAGRNVAQPKLYPGVGPGRVTHFAEQDQPAPYRLGYISTRRRRRCCKSRRRVTELGGAKNYSRRAGSRIQSSPMKKLRGVRSRRRREYSRTASSAAQHERRNRAVTTGAGSHEMNVNITGQSSVQEARASRAVRARRIITVASALCRRLPRRSSRQHGVEKFREVEARRATAAVMSRRHQLCNE